MPACDATAGRAPCWIELMTSEVPRARKATVADLLDDVVGLSTGFTMAAHKQIPEGGSAR